MMNYQEQLDKLDNKVYDFAQKIAQGDDNLAYQIEFAITCFMNEAVYLDNIAQLSIENFDTSAIEKELEQIKY